MHPSAVTFNFISTIPSKFHYDVINSIIREPKKIDDTSADTFRPKYIQEKFLEDRPVMQNSFIIY